MTVGLIWAQTPAGVIGRDGGIPWHLPEDLAHFKQSTLSAAVVMGRRTWDSLPARNRPLPGRRNIVVTRQPEWSATGAESAPSVDAALDLVADAWVIGGAEIYREALQRASELLVTEVHVDVDGDTFAPAIGDEFTLVDDGAWQQSRVDGTRFRFRRYVRTSEFSDPASRSPS